MVEIADIKDRGSLKKWLDGQSSDVGFWIARRAALRVFPIFWLSIVDTDVIKYRDLPIITILRPNLVSEVKCFAPSSEFTKALMNAENRAYAFDMLFAAAAAAYDTEDRASMASSAFAFVFAVPPNASESISSAVKAVGDAAIATAGHTQLFWHTIRQDCQQVDRADQAKMAALPLGKLPLWAGGKNPLMQEWNVLKATLPAASAARSEESDRDPENVDWGFWIKWYDSVLAGKPLNGEMLHEIALIKDEAWEKGEAEVQHIINEIWQRYQLKDQIAALENELRSASARTAKIGDNQGPPLDDVPMAQEVLIIWEPLQALKQEVNSDAPDKGKVAEWVEVLASIAAAILEYVSHKADKFVDGAMGAAGKAAGVAAVGAFVTWYNGVGVSDIVTFAESVAQVARTAVAWGKLLP